MTQGSSSGASGKRWRYYKLSPSKKTLQYGDFNEKFTPVIKSYERLSNKVDLSSVAEIKPLNTRVAAAAASGGSMTLSNVGSSASLAETTASLSFALYSSNNVPLAEFICSSSAQASEWKDGFSMLLDKGITSKDTAEYLHSLTEIGVKVKLLQIAGDRVEIPHSHVEAPPVPVGLGSGFFYSTG